MRKPVPTWPHSQNATFGEMEGGAGQGTTQALHEGGPVSDGGGGGDADGVCDITHIRACGRACLLVLMPHCGT